MARKAHKVKVHATKAVHKNATHTTRATGHTKKAAHSLRLSKHATHSLKGVRGIKR